MKIAFLLTFLLLGATPVLAQWFVFPPNPHRGDAIEIQGPVVEKDARVFIQWNDTLVQSAEIKKGEPIGLHWSSSLGLPTGTYDIFVAPFSEPVYSFFIGPSRHGAYWIAHPLTNPPVVVEKNHVFSLDFRVLDAGQTVNNANCLAFFLDQPLPCSFLGEGRYRLDFRVPKNMESGPHALSVVWFDDDSGTGGEWSTQVVVQPLIPIVEIETDQKKAEEPLTHLAVRATYPDRTAFSGTLVVSFGSPIDEKGTTSIVQSSDDGVFHVSFSRAFFKNPFEHVQIRLEDATHNTWNTQLTLERFVPWFERPVGPFSLLLTGVFLAIGFGMMLDGIVRVIQIRRNKNRLRALQAEKQNIIQNFELLRSMDEEEFRKRLAAIEKEQASVRQQLDVFDAEE